MTWPSMLANLAIFVIDLTDIWFISNSSPAELSAITLLLPFIYLLNSIMLGMGSGITVVISQNYTRDHNSIKWLSLHSFIFGITISLMISTLLFLTSDLLLNHFIQDTVIRNHMKEYIEVYIYGGPILLSSILTTCCLRGIGNSKTPSLVLVIVALINLILDPLLIFGYGPIEPMGIQGAALATLFARVVGSLIVIRALYKNNMITLTLNNISYSFKHFFAIGLPVTVGKVLAPIAAILTTGIIATQGLYAITAYWVGVKIDKIAMVPLTSIAHSMTPIVGANWGIGNIKRVLLSWNLSTIVLFSWSICVMLLLISFNESIANAFTDDPRVAAILQDYITIIVCSYAGFGLVKVTIATLNSTNHANLGCVLSLLHTIILTLPLCYLGATLHGINGIFLGYCISAWLIAFIAIYVYKMKVASYRLTDHEQLRLLYMQHLPDEVRSNITSALFWEKLIIKFEQAIKRILIKPFSLSKSKNN